MQQTSASSDEEDGDEEDGNDDHEIREVENNDGSDDDDEEPCDAEVCIIMESEEDNLTWLQCDHCSKWFHMFCCGTKVTPQNFLCKQCGL